MGNIKASIDRGTLENLVKTAESKDLSGYPAAKVEEFQAVLDAAKTVLEKEDATIEEIREAVENLQKASNKLGTVRDPYVRLEAEDYDGGDVVKDVDSNRSGGGNIGGGKNGCYAVYNNVNFGENGAVHVVMSYSSQGSDASDDGRIQFFLDSMDGEPVAELETHNTAQSGWSTYVLTETDIEPPITGSHDLYIKLVGTPDKAYVANIDYFDFTEGQGGVSGTYDLAVQYSGRDASLCVDGEPQTIADKIGQYRGEAETDTEVELTFTPAVEGRAFAGVTLNGEALELTDPESFTYTYTMGTKDANLNFVFTVVDKSLLQKVIDTAQALVDNGELEGVVPSVQEKFEDALAAAEEVNGKLDATQEEIDNAWSELLDAIHLLSFELGDTTVLESLLEVAGSLAEEDFTADSWAALEEAVAAAEAVVSEEEPLKADVEEAEKDLYEALTNLVQ
ncbi:MAG: carbohydrate-binding protein, partial [Anaeromassilibacillus sp.]